MPQSIQAALSVIDQVAPNLSDDHVAELKKKLPPIALHFERAGRPLSKAQITDYASRPLEVFRAAASSLTQKQGQESQRSYDDIAANFAAQREEKILQAMGPWCAVIEGADLELAKKLVADETPFPDQRDVQDEMILRLMDEQRQDIFKLLAQSGRIIAPERLGEGGGHYDIFRLNVRRLLFGLYGNRISNKLSYAHIALLLDMWPGLAEDMMIKDHLLKRLAIQGNLENFKRIYERYFSPMHPDTRIITCAAENGHFDIVKYLCDLYAKEDKGLPLCSLSGITDTSIKQYLEKLMGQGAQKGKADGDSAAKAKQQADAQYATEMLSVLRWHNEQLPVLAKSAPPEVMQHMLLSLIEHLGIEQKSSGYGAYVRSMTSYDDPQRPLDLAELYQRELNMNWMTGLKIGSDKYKVLDALIGQNARFLIAFVKELKALKAQLLRISIKDAVIPMGFYHSNVGALLSSIVSQAAVRNDTELLSALLGDQLALKQFAGQALDSALVRKQWDMVAFLLGKGVSSDLYKKHQQAYDRKLRNYKAWEKAHPGFDVPQTLEALAPEYIKMDVYRTVRDVLFQENAKVSKVQSDTQLCFQAYHLAALFRSEDRVLQYLEKWGDRETEAPLIALSRDLKITQDGRFDVKAWGDAVLKYGPEMAKLLSHAHHMPRPKETLQQTRQTMAQFVFKRGTERPEFAALCFQLNIGEQSFNEALDIIAEHEGKPAQTSNIPHLEIDGKDFDMPGARFVKLPDNDVRGLVLGEYVDCCQHIGDSNGARCAIHGYTSPDGGFYVLYSRSGDVIGQTWAWRGIKGELVFDSLEALRDRVSTEQWKKIMQQCAEHLQEKPGDLAALIVGKGGETPHDIGFDEVPESSKAQPKDHKGYGDSRNQLLVWKKKCHGMRLTPNAPG